MGWKSLPTTTVTFENCKVPKKNLLGKEGFKYSMMAMDSGRVNIGNCLKYYFLNR